MLNPKNIFSISCKLLSSLTKSSKNTIELRFENPSSPITYELLPFNKSANLAKFVYENVTLQKLLIMGVNLSAFDKLPDVPMKIIQYDFERDIKPHLAFLIGCNVSPLDFGHIITNNPHLFQQSLEDLKIRINYLLHKKFSEADITYLITKYPTVLNLTTTDLDGRLGKIQKLFDITAKDVRKAFLGLPSIIEHDFQLIKLNALTCNKEFDMSKDEVQTAFKQYPSVFTLGRERLVTNWNYLTLYMHIPKSNILHWPNILTARTSRIKERHGFLKRNRRNQYDPTKPLYISLKQFVEGSDQEFCENVAKVSFNTYCDYLKTL